MGFIMDFAKAFSGQDDRSSSSGSSHGSSHSSSSLDKPTMYQCRRCGRRQSVYNVYKLERSNYGCNHVWERFE
ncbi:MAG: hypothetical protein IJ794_00280 [Lachnospiraceae bacterium]|nr:hypothetical protein [Lachnospiraceae bacterium]